MKKIAQSILDFLNSFPTEILKAPRTTALSPKEAKLLYEIWNGKQDSYGRPILTDSTDSMILASLVTKGIIKNHPIPIPGSNTIEITPIGRDIIKKIILTSEQSKFSNSKQEINYANVVAPDKKTKTALNWIWRAKYGN